MTITKGELEPIETASIDELRALQLERLRWSLRHAYENVRYYREAFDAAGGEVGDIRACLPHLGCAEGGAVVRLGAEVEGRHEVEGWF